MGRPIVSRKKQPFAKPLSDAEKERLRNELLDKAARELSAPPGLVPFTSRSPHSPWFDRIDPFHLGFGANPSYGWQPHQRIEWRAVWHPYGPKLLPRWVPEVVTPEGKKWTSPGGRIERVAALLLSWRILTSQQIAAFGSMDQSGTSRTLDQMMKAGLVERSKMVALYSASGAIPYLWRLRAESKEFASWFRSLPGERRASLTLGVEGGSGGHERHDVLVAEIALRAAEVIPRLQTVFGERATAAKVLLKQAPKVRSRGDALIVRNDGLQIILEVTTQPMIKEVRRKIAQWARLLGERGGPNETGLVVVFVSAEYGGKGGVELLQRAFDLAMSPEVIGGDNPSPPEVMLAARASLFVAHWQDWFPAAWCISERFAGLEAYYSRATKDFRPVNVARAGTGGVDFRPSTNLAVVDYREERGERPAVPRWIEGKVQWEVRKAAVS